MIHKIRTNFYYGSLDKLGSSVPDEPTNPPEPEDYDKNLRNSYRHDIIEACYTIIDRLNELAPKGFKGTIHLLKETMDYMSRDMED